MFSILLRAATKSTPALTAFLVALISSGLGAIGVDLTPAGKGTAVAPAVGETTGAGAGALAVTGAATVGAGAACAALGTTVAVFVTAGIFPLNVGLGIESGNGAGCVYTTSIDPSARTR